MLAMKLGTRLALTEDIMLQAISELDHYYAFNVANGDHFELNHTAYWVLETIGQGVTLAELRERFEGQFDIDPGTADEDLTEVLGFGIENHIIKEVEA